MGKDVSTIILDSKKAILDMKNDTILAQNLLLSKKLDERTILKIISRALLLQKGTHMNSFVNNVNNFYTLSNHAKDYSFRRIRKALENIDAFAKNFIVGEKLDVKERNTFLEVILDILEHLEDETNKTFKKLGDSSERSK